MTDGKGCECFARCEADCVCDADWTPEEVIRLRADIERHIAIASEHATECERLRAALADAINRMDIAREIVRTPHGGNWAMLETDSLKAALAAREE